MADANPLWGLLKQAADPSVAQALEKSVESDPDRALNRINPLAYAAEHGLDEEETIGGFVHAARLGLFDMSWNMLCPGCGGVLEAGAGLKTLDHTHYYCSLCAADYEPTLDKLVEVTFTVNQSVRRIAAHDPDSLPFAEYMRQIFWSSSNDLPEDVESAIERVTLDVMELGAGEKAAMSLTLPKGFAIVFDPVTHSSLFLDVDGEETRERRNLSLVFADAHAHNDQPYQQDRQVIRVLPDAVGENAQAHGDQRDTDHQNLARPAFVHEGAGEWHCRHRAESVWDQM